MDFQAEREKILDALEPFNLNEATHLGQNQITPAVIVNPDDFEYSFTMDGDINPNWIVSLIVSYTDPPAARAQVELWITPDSGESVVDALDDIEGVSVTGCRNVGAFSGPGETVYFGAELVCSIIE